MDSRRSCAAGFTPRRPGPATCGPSCASLLLGILRRHPARPAQARPPFRPSTCPGLLAASKLSELLPLQTARDSVFAVGFEHPSWHDLLHGEEPRRLIQDTEQLHKDSWLAACHVQAVDGFCQRALLRQMDASSASQAGPYAARVLNARPTSPQLTWNPAVPRSPVASAPLATPAYCKKMPVSPTI